MLIEKLYKIFLDHPVISTDTRNIIPGSIFFALRGHNFNGNSFTKEALNKGAAYCVIDESEIKDKTNCILVTNVLETLQKLANFHRRNIKTTIIAITGSNGKTTTKELLNAVLKSTYHVKATTGNLNNHIGVPLTLLKLNQDTEYGIIEMGANHPGEIDLLCRIAEPDAGIITNIGKAHIEGFGSFEGVVQTKTELYRYLSEKNGSLFYNSSNAILKTHAIKSNCKLVSYGNKTDDVFALNTQANPYLHLDIHYNNHTYNSLSTHIIGNYNTENILAALCIGTFYNVNIHNAMNSISDYKPSNMRSQFIQTKKNKIILDAYNANPTSMELALNNLNNLKSNNKAVIIGDMLELGSSTEEEHLTVLNQLGELNLKHVILVGKEFSRLNKNELFRTFINLSDLITSEILNKIENCDILIKGSRGIGLEKTVEYL